jgi:putative isomerase
MISKIKLLAVVFFISFQAFAQYTRDQFINVLDLRSSLVQSNVSNTSAALFSDMGAWQAYSLPARTEEYGGFNGPALFNRRGEVISESVAQLALEINGQPYSFGNPQAVYLPGMAVMKYSSEGIELEQSLIFSNSRTALVKNVIRNTRTEAIQAKLSWHGALKAKSTLTTEKGQFKIDLKSGCYLIDFPWSDKLAFTVEGSKYSVDCKDLVTVEPSGAITFYVQHSNFISSKDCAEKYQLELHPEQCFVQNQHRWNEYIRKALSKSTGLGSDPSFKNLKVKAVVTLMTNWRSAAGDLKHDGIFPSFSTFDGFWAWDSWKHAAACARFFPELGKNNIRAMFDYQDEAGMVADCVYITSADNNYRDTKPPLAAWAVWEIYRHTGDKAFVQEMFPKLIKYHRWWYANRDHDRNGLCEFGSTDGTRQAAAWESGMDNAVRYDKAIMLKNNDKAWSLDQESVDLNSFLYLEKLVLADMCKLLNVSGSKGLEREAVQLKKTINQLMYDRKTGYYYDVKIADKTKMLMEGTEGWHPLWAKIASKEQAQKVALVLADTARFNTFVPFPTYPANRPEFDPVHGYWRGPVWLDQVLFGVEGLRNYQLNKQADTMLLKLLNNAEGMKDNQPINENYNPLTGKRLGANHFSWSAASLLMLLSE